MMRNPIIEQLLNNFQKNVVTSNPVKIFSSNGKYLFIEFQPIGLDISSIQRDMYEKLTNDKAFIAIVVTGIIDIIDIKTINIFQNGKASGLTDCDLSTFKKMLTNWSEFAETIEENWINHFFA